MRVNLEFEYGKKRRATNSYNNDLHIVTANKETYSNESEKSVYQEEQEIWLPLETVGGQEVQCLVVAIFSVGEVQYIALSPNGDEETLLFRYDTISDEDIRLEDITDDEEFESAVEVFSELMREE